MDICSRADDHLNENISTIDNYATGDTLQFMVKIDGLDGEQGRLEVTSVMSQSNSYHEI